MSEDGSVNWCGPVYVLSPQSNGQLCVLPLAANWGRATLRRWLREGPKRPAVRP